MAKVIERAGRPALVLAPNKTLAAQLYGEMREFFPDNAVEYFVSYYDYYQPEAYVPSTDTYIEKDASINDHIEQMRLSATKALLEHGDCIIVATVSSIYGLGDPVSYHGMVLHLVRGETVDQRFILRRLAEMQYTRNEVELHRGTYRVRGEVIDVYPAESEKDAVRIELFDDEIESLSHFDPLTGEIVRRVPRLTIYPKSHYVTPRERVLEAIEAIKEELIEHLAALRAANKLVEAQRLEQRTRFDLEMMTEIGHCKGIENYSRFLSGRRPGEPPPTLFDYLPSRCAPVHRREPRHRAAARGHVPRRPLAQGNAGPSTDSVSRRRSTTGRYASTSSNASPPRRSSCPRRRDPTKRGTRERWWSSSSARPGSSTPTSRCVPPRPRWTTCSPRSTAAPMPASGCW